MSLKAPNLPQPDTDQPHQAGETQAFPGGHITYLSPKPLPTGYEALDLNGSVSSVNETCLDVGGGYMDVFGWQLLTGVTFGFFLLSSLVFPTTFWLLLPDASFDFIWDNYTFGFWVGVAGGGVGFLAMFWGHRGGLKLLRNTPPRAFTVNVAKSAL